jgi:hypothetical protein
MGGYDIFRSDLDEKGEWGRPVNMGYPVNTTDDDLFFVPVGKGNTGYLSKFSTDGYGKMDIFRYEIFSDLNPRNFFITGKAGISNLLSEFQQPVKVTAVNNADTERMMSALTNPVSGLYSFRLPQGSYKFTFTSDDALTMSQNHEMPVTFKGDTVSIEPVTLYSTDVFAYLKLLSDTVVNVTSAQPVPFDLIVEDRSILDIKVFSPDSVISSEQHRMSDTTFTFSFPPPRGESRITFSLTDRFGNTASVVARVTRTGQVRSLRPLYHEIPVRTEAGPAGEEKVTGKDAAAPETTIIAPATAGEEVTKDKTEGEGHRCLWWLILIPALIIFFILRRGKKKKKEENR